MRRAALAALAAAAAAAAPAALAWTARHKQPRRCAEPGRTVSKASRDLARDGRRCPDRASGAAVPWHGQNGGPGARPPRHALYGQRLDAPTE
eukprot:scaffold47727_cov69-Phaeocystis_antarctica.AAC.2